MLIHIISSNIYIEKAEPNALIYLFLCISSYSHSENYDEFNSKLAVLILNS